MKISYQNIVGQKGLDLFYLEFVRLPIAIRLIYLPLTSLTFIIFFLINPSGYRLILKLIKVIKTLFPGCPLPPKEASLNVLYETTYLES